MVVMLAVDWLVSFCRLFQSKLSITEMLEQSQNTSFSYNKIKHVLASYLFINIRTSILTNQTQITPELFCQSRGNCRCIVHTFDTISVYITIANSYVHFWFINKKHKICKNIRRKWKEEIGMEMCQNLIKKERNWFMTYSSVQHCWLETLWNNYV